MPDSHGYPLVQTLGTGTLMHHARPAALPGRVETRCGLEGDKTDRDGGIWCPDCLALERTKAGTHDERGGDGDPYDWDPVYAATAIDRLQKQLAAANARAEKAEALRREDVAAARRERDEAKAETVKLNAYLTLVVARYGNQTFYERDVKRAAELSAALAPDAAPDGRSEPVERSETSGAASNSSTGTAGLSEPEPPRDTSAWCWAPSPHTLLHCGLLRDHEPPHQRGERTWTSDDTTEDGQHG